MAGAYVQTARGMSQDEYDKVTRELRERRGTDAPPEGALFHDWPPPGVEPMEVLAVLRSE